MIAAYAADVPPIHHAPAHEVARLRELARAATSERPRPRGRCGPRFVPHADGSTGPAEGTTTSSEPPLPTSAGSTTAQAEGTGSATGAGADTSDTGTTQGAQLDTSTGEVASAGGTSTSGEPGTSTSTGGEPGRSTGTGNVMRPNMDTCDTDRSTEICACAR